MTAQNVTAFGGAVRPPDREAAKGAKGAKIARRGRDWVSALRGELRG